MKFWKHPLGFFLGALLAIGGSALAAVVWTHYPPPGQTYTTTPSNTVLTVGAAVTSQTQPILQVGPTSFNSTGNGQLMCCGATTTSVGPIIVATDSFVFQNDTNSVVLGNTNDFFFSSAANKSPTLRLADPGLNGSAGFVNNVNQGGANGVVDLWICAYTGTILQPGNVGSIPNATPPQCAMSSSTGTSTAAGAGAFSWSPQNALMVYWDGIGDLLQEFVPTGGVNFNADITVRKCNNPNPANNNITCVIGDNTQAGSITNIVGGSAANTQANGSPIVSQATGLVSAGATFTITSGCATTSALTGGNTAGSFSTTTTGTCTPVIALPTAPHGWVCHADDLTHPVVFTQTANSISSCTVSGATTSGDTIVFLAVGY